MEKSTLTIIKQCLKCGGVFVAGIHSERTTCEICLSKVIADTAYELTDVELANLALEDDATRLAEVDDEDITSSEVDKKEQYITEEVKHCKNCRHPRRSHRRLIDPDSGCPIWCECRFPDCLCRIFEEACYETDKEKCKSCDGKGYIVVPVDCLDQYVSVVTPGNI